MLNKLIDLFVVVMIFLINPPNQIMTAPPGRPPPSLPRTVIPLTQLRKTMDTIREEEKRLS